MWRISERDEILLSNVLLGTDYLMSLTATGRSRGPSGCLLLVAVLVLLVTLWLVW